MSQSFSHNSNSFNTSYTINVSNYVIVADDDEDRPSILAELPPLDPSSRHRGIQDPRVESAGDFIRPALSRSPNRLASQVTTNQSIGFCMLKAEKEQRRAPCPKAFIRKE